MEIVKTLSETKITGLTVSSCITLTFPQNQWCL